MQVIRGFFLFRFPNVNFNDVMIFTCLWIAQTRPSYISLMLFSVKVWVLFQQIMKGKRKHAQQNFFI